MEGSATNERKLETNALPKPPVCDIIVFGAIAFVNTLWKDTTIKTFEDLFHQIKGFSNQVIGSFDSFHKVILKNITQRILTE